MMSRSLADSLKAVVVSAMLVAAITGCSATKEESPGPELPAGTELGEWDSTVKMGESVRIVLGDQAGGTSGSLVRLEVVEVRKGNAEDLGTFSGVPQGAVPWYVSVETHNRGPQEVDLAREKGWVLRVADNLVIPPALVEGYIAECPTAEAEPVLPVGAEGLDCLVFLVKGNQKPSKIEFLRHDGISTIGWQIPSSVGAAE